MVLCVFQSLGPAVSPADPQRPADLVVPVSPTEPSLSSSSDGGDMTCCDLLSLRSDSLSLASEPAISRTVSHRPSSSSTDSVLQVQTVGLNSSCHVVSELVLRQAAVGLNLNVLSSSFSCTEAET